jgi:hypothetical protein
MSSLLHDAFDNSTRDNFKSPREKFRAACDRCAASKVRCEKQQPKCYRCQQLRLDCVYGRSRRKGKPTSKMAMSLEPQTQMSSKSPEAQAEDSQFQLWPLADPYDAFADFPTRASRENTMPGEILNNDFWESYSPFSIMYSQENAQRPTSNSISEDHFMNSESAALLVSPPTTTVSSASATTGPDTQRPDLVRVIVNDDPSSSCITSAFITLSSLYHLVRSNEDSKLAADHSSNSAASAPPQPSSDIILLSTRSATITLSRLLACTCAPCTKDPNLPFLLATIAAKVLSWYRALYNSEICPHRHSASPSPAEQRRAHSSSISSTSTTSRAPSTLTEDAVCTMPLTIGAFHLPRATETRMKAQLLLCELQPLGQACNALGGRMRIGEDNRSERAVCEAFEGFLLRGVGELRRSLEAVCGRIE